MLKKFLKAIMQNCINLKLWYIKVFKAKNKHKLPLSIRLRMNLKGFTADQYIRYDLKVNDIKEYISDYHRWKTRDINGRYNIIFDDKLIFKEIFGKYINIPNNLAWLNNGDVYNLQGGLYDEEDIALLLDKKKKLIIKPVKFGGGKNVSIISQSPDSVELNYQPVGFSAIINYLRQQKDSIITEFIEQHPYASKLYDKTTNTIRLVTVFDKEKHSFRVVSALHRIGTKYTIPVDNAAKGGLVSEIDIETGIMGPSKTYYNKRIYEIHPDSCNVISGTHIPYWNKTRDTIVNIANLFPYIRFIAWDIVITEDGFTVIEGNASTGISLFQLWRGVRNTELGQFYESCGVFR